MEGNAGEDDLVSSNEIFDVELLEENVLLEVCVNSLKDKERDGLEEHISGRLEQLSGESKELSVEKILTNNKQYTNYAKGKEMIIKELDLDRVNKTDMSQGHEPKQENLCQRTWPSGIAIGPGSLGQEARSDVEFHNNTSKK
ncbi:unnamed protein product [Lupinus luteus]|uniref:Uncharacterized protein n=1 Tax=Lupinus luteus TaxID=3873 RepID=A0AAV1WNE7_LUPLU